MAQARAVLKRGFVARSGKGGMSRKGFSFDSSKFLGRKSPMCSVALNLLLCFDLLAKLRVVAKVFNLKEHKEQKERSELLIAIHRTALAVSPKCYLLACCGWVFLQLWAVTFSLSTKGSDCWGFVLK